MSHKSLTRKGYVVKKKNLKPEEHLEIQKELCFKPFVIPAFADFIPEKKFYTYLESIHRYYLPSYYGLSKFGPPEKNLLENTGTNTNFKVFWDILPHQVKAWNALTNKYQKEKQGGIMSLYCGGGKCLGVDTPVLMYDGTFKMSQDIRPLDLLMGEDSTPRTVLGTNSGEEMMYEIKPKQGDSYIVNESHILSLIFVTNYNLNGKEYKKGDIIDIPLKEYLKINVSKNILKGFRVPIRFPFNKKGINPYDLGLNVSELGQIWREYLFNSVDVQLLLLAGILDSIGKINKPRNKYKIELSKLKNKEIGKDILYLCRSIGYAAFIEKNRYISIYGQNLEEIPVKKDSMKASKKYQIRNSRTTEIEVKKLKVDKYYGFELDGNGRFLLGDFQVTHNTFLAIKLGSFLKKKMLVIVNKEFLMNQWKEAIQKCSNARVGIIQQKKVDIENKDIVIAMLHSVCKIDYPEGTFDSFGYCVVDECFPYKQHILTEYGPIEIGELYKLWKNKKELPLVLSFNEKYHNFEYKKITYAWKREKNTELIKLYINDSEIECTPDHYFLTKRGWKKAETITDFDKIYTSKNLVYHQIEEPSTYSSRKCISVYDLEVADNHNFIVCNSKGKDEIVAHNCHHIASQMFSQALPKISTQHMLGLSATPERKDGLTPVFLNYLGPIFHRERRKGANQVWIKFLEVASSSEHYQEEVMEKSGTKNTVKMINNLSDYEVLNHLILELVRILVKNKPRKIIILGKRREQLEWLNSHCQEGCFKNSKGKYATCGLYYGNKGLRKDAYYKMLEESAKCDIIFGTNEIASEGLDIPGLNTLILLQGGHDVEQAVGRILRKLHKEVPPTVIDMVYKCGNFPKHAKKRRDYYNYEKYCHHPFKMRIGDDIASINPWLPKLEEFLENYTDPKAKNFIKEEHLEELVLEDDEDDPKSKSNSKSKSKSKSKSNEPIGSCLIDSSDSEDEDEAKQRISKSTNADSKISLNLSMK